MRKLHRDEDGTLPAYAWPGGYQIIYLTKSNCLLCPDCANKTDRDPDHSDPVVAQDIFYEGASEWCEDCGEAIESAYGDPDSEDNEEQE